MRRTLIAAGATALLACAVALPAAADGLSRFEQAIKKAQDTGKFPAGTLTYKSAKALGDNGFVLEDVVLTPPPEKNSSKAEPIPIKRVSVDEFDFDSLDKNTPPLFLKLRAEGIAINGKPANGIDLAQMAGIDKATGDFQLDYRLDPRSRTMTVNRFEFDLDGLARLELSMVLDGVDANKPDTAMNDATLRTATVVFDDRSLLGKAVPAAAKAEGSDADALIKIGTVFLDGMRKDQGPATLGVLDAVESYMQDYRHPKGPLRLTLTPPSKVSFAAVAGMKNPDEMIKALGLAVSYPGTRPQAPSAPAVATEAGKIASAIMAGQPSCAVGARLFVMHEEAWWAVTVREASASGDKCIARIDGGSDDIAFAPATALAWSLDGPGKPLDKCNEGRAVVALYKDGGWYPAAITDKSAASGQCPVKYKDDGSEDTLELKNIRRLD